MRKINLSILIAVFCRLLTTTACAMEPDALAKPTAVITEQEAYEIGLEAYVYLHPLITMDITRRVMTNVPPGIKGGLGPMNSFHHYRAYPTAKDREVVRPNFDTLYSWTWLDLTEEPMIVSVKDTNGRYFMLPMLDMWSDVFACPGKRTSGTKDQNYAVVPDGWIGKLPKGVGRIVSPTPYIWILGRTQTNGPKDYEAVHKVQDGYTITPLSKWGKEFEVPPFKEDKTVDMETAPATQVLEMSATEYFGYSAELMKVNKPHITDWSQITRLKRIGIVPGESFDLAKAPLAVVAGVKLAHTDGVKTMMAALPSMAPVIEGWQTNITSMGVYGNFYMKRALTAYLGLGANQPQDAIYPIALSDIDGNPITAENKYVLHFEKDELPPAGAFWSVTMYDHESFQVDNVLNRYALGDRDPLVYNNDGSLDIFIQQESPGQEKESNWLPSAKAGLLNITMRVYAPKVEAFDGRWHPPGIKRVKS